MKFFTKAVDYLSNFTSYQPAKKKGASADLESIEMTKIGKFEINEQEFYDMVGKANKGINTYLETYKGSGLKLYHNGMFSLRFHGGVGVFRATYYQNTFKSNSASKADKLTALYALLASKDGKTIQEEVLKRIGIDQDLLLKQLSKMLIKEGITDEAIAQQVARANSA